MERSVTLRVMIHGMFVFLDTVTMSIWSGDLKLD